MKKELYGVVWGLSPYVLRNIDFDLGEVVLVPRLEVLKRLKNKKKVAEKVVAFPGYGFVRAEDIPAVRPYRLRFLNAVGSDKPLLVPWPLPVPGEVHDAPPVPTYNWHVGEKGQIKLGPWAGLPFTVRATLPKVVKITVEGGNGPLTMVVSRVILQTMAL